MSDDLVPTTSDRTALHARVRGLVPLGSARDADRLVAALNEFLDVAVPVIANHGGLISGAPAEELTAVLPDPGAACAAAVELLEQVATRSSAEVSVGIAAGPLVLGQVGPTAQLVATAIGEPVRLAASLAGLTRRLDVPVVMTRHVARQIDPTLVRELGWIEVRGVDEPVRIATFAAYGQLDTGELDVDVIDVT